MRGRVWVRLVVLVLAWCCLLVCLIDWLWVSWSIGLWVCLFACWFVGRLVAWQVGWLVVVRCPLVGVFFGAC